jgi:hypothetical protein
LGSAAPLTGSASPNSLAGVASQNSFPQGGAYLTPDNAASFIIYRSVAQATTAAGLIGAGQTAVAAATSAPSCPVQNLNTSEVFKTIQSAIDAPATLNGHSIAVAAGTYAENVDVTKSLTIRGANFGINPNTGSRVAETIVVPATSLPSAGVVFRLSADNITFDGLTVDGDNPSLTSGTVFAGGGGDVDALELITNYQVPNVSREGIVVRNNILKNAYYGVDIYNNSATSTTGNLIENNKFQYFNELPSDYGIAVLLYNNAYSTVKDNAFTSVGIGIQTGNFNLADAGSSHTFSGNSITSSIVGVFHNLHYQSATPFVIQNNTLATIAGANGEDNVGIVLWSLDGTATALAINNTITGGLAGYEVWNTNAGPTISGGSVSGAKHGVYVTDKSSFGNNSPSTVTVTGVNISNYETAGIEIIDTPDDATPVNLSVTVNGNTNITGSSGNKKGVFVNGPSAKANIANNSSSVISNAIGIDIDAGTATITNTKLNLNGTGVRVRNAGVLTGASGNFITNNTDYGIDIESSAGNIGAINNNDLSGNGTAAIRNAKNASPDINAECNWYGSSATVSYAKTGAEAAKVDICPALNSGTDDGGNPADGFQPVAGACVALSVTAINPTAACMGSSVTLSATVTGASGTPTYSWSVVSGDALTNANTANPSFTAMTTGATYSVTVTSGVCTASSSISFSVYPKPRLSATINSVAVTSNNDGTTDTGSFSVCTGVTNNITFGPFTDANSITPVGTLRVFQTVTHNNTSAPFCTNCQAVPSAFNGATGTVSLVHTAMAGTMVITFQLFDDRNNNSTMDSGECAGDVVSYSVTVNPLPTVVIMTPVAVCLGGITTLSATSGMSQYSWASGAGTFSPQSATPTLTATAAVGSYTVSLSVTNSNGCTNATTATATINALPTPTITTPISVCANGTVTLSATSPWSGYSWATNAGTFSNATAAMPTLTGGNTAGNSYSVTLTVTDANGCKGSAVANVTVLPQPVISTPPLVTPATCANSSDGAIDISVTGTPTLTYSWSRNGGSFMNPATEDLINISAGTYNVTVTDGNSCAAVRNGIVVGVNPSYNLSASILNVLCNGGTGGSIGLTVNGGNTPFNYSWTRNGAGFTTITNGSNSAGGIGSLTAGTYNVTVTDGGGCTLTGRYVVTQPAALNATLALSKIACAGNNGIITLTISGGTGPKSFIFSGPTSIASSTVANGSYTFNNLAGGTYNVTVTDDNECETYASVNVPSSGSLPLSINFSSSICNGQNFQLSTNYAGFPGVRYRWAGPGSFSSTAASPTANLGTATSGVYRVSATVTGCTAIASAITTITTFGIANVGTIGVTGRPYSAATNTITVCRGSGFTFQLTGALGNEFNWRGPAGSGFTATTASPSVTVPNTSNAFQGQYTVTARFIGCTPFNHKVINIQLVNCASRLATAEEADGEGISLQVNPNPVEQIATIDVKLQKASTVQVKLLQVGDGRVLQTLMSIGEATQHRFELDMTHQTAGTYLILAEAEHGQAVKKIVKVTNRD